MLGDAFLRPRAAGETQAAVHQAERAAVQQADLALVAQAPQVGIEVDQVLQQALLVEAPVVRVLLVAVPVGPAVLQVAEADAQVVAPEADQGRGLVVRSVVVAA